MPLFGLQLHDNNTTAVVLLSCNCKPKSGILCLTHMSWNLNFFQNLLKCRKITKSCWHLMLWENFDVPTLSTILSRTLASFQTLDCVRPTKLIKDICYWSITYKIAMRFKSGSVHIYTLIKFIIKINEAASFLLWQIII